MQLQNQLGTIINFRLVQSMVLAIFPEDQNLDAPDGGQAKRHNIVMLLASQGSASVKCEYLADLEARDGDLAKMWGELEELGWLRLDDLSGCLVNPMKLRDEALAMWTADPPKEMHRLCMVIPLQRQSLLTLYYKAKKARDLDFKALSAVLNPAEGRP